MALQAVVHTAALGPLTPRVAHDVVLGSAGPLAVYLEGPRVVTVEERCVIIVPLQQMTKMTVFAVS